MQLPTKAQVKAVMQTKPPKQAPFQSENALSDYVDTWFDTYKPTTAAHSFALGDLIWECAAEQFGTTWKD